MRALLIALCALPLGAARAEGLTSIDHKFLNDATQDSLAEVKLGQLAIDRGMSNQVRTLGRRLVDDHTRMGEDLARAADRLDVKLPTTLTSAQQKEFDRLSRLPRDQFDRAFLQAAVRDHDKAIHLFQREARDGNVRELRRIADQTLPTLRQHRDLALGGERRGVG